MLQGVEADGVRLVFGGAGAFWGFKEGRPRTAA